MGRLVILREIVSSILTKEVLKGQGCYGGCGDAAAPPRLGVVSNIYRVYRVWPR